MTKNLSEEFLCRICFNPLIEFGAIIAELNSAKFIDLLLMKQIRKTNFTKFGKIQFIQSTQKKFSPQKFLPLTYVLAKYRSFGGFLFADFEKNNIVKNIEMNNLLRLIPLKIKMTIHINKCI